MKSFPHQTLCVVAIAVMMGLVLTNFGRADDKPQPKDPPKKRLTVMQRKLAYSQTILQALALEDFKKLDEAADGLIECVKDATWRINQTQQYLVYTNDFLRRAQGLKKAAKDKNIDAASLNYVDLTLTCVKCHQFLRTPARAVPNSPANGVLPINK